MKIVTYTVLSFILSFSLSHEVFILFGFDFYVCLRWGSNFILYMYSETFVTEPFAPLTMPVRLWDSSLLHYLGFPFLYQSHTPFAAKALN
jgi:hypothetical protein